MLLYDSLKLNAEFQQDCPQKLTVADTNDKLLCYIEAFPILIESPIIWAETLMCPF